MWMSSKSQNLRYYDTQHLVSSQYKHLYLPCPLSTIYCFVRGPDLTQYLPQHSSFTLAWPRFQLMGIPSPRAISPFTPPESCTLKSKPEKVFQVHRISEQRRHRLSQQNPSSPPVSLQLPNLKDASITRVLL